MIGVIGGNGITLKKLMLRSGFPKAEQAINRHSMIGVFNTSFPEGVMLRRVPSWVRDYPMINKVLVTNKLQALRAMDAVGMSEHIPEYSIDRRYEDGWIVKPYASQAGHGIHRYVSGSPVHGGTYLQRDVVKFREFRAHVGLWLDSPVFTIQEKKPKEELWEHVFGGMDHEYEWPIRNTAMRGFLPVTWNIESGFYFRRTTTPSTREEKVSRFPLIKRIEKVATKAVKALKYQYGAVDILMNENRELFIVEVNSHPAIKNPASVDIYMEVLRPLAQLSREEFNNLVERTTSTITFRRTNV